MSGSFPLSLLDGLCPLFTYGITLDNILSPRCKYKYGDLHSFSQTKTSGDVYSLVEFLIIFFSSISLSIEQGALGGKATGKASNQ